MAYEEIAKVADHFVKFYFTDSGDKCPYRYGQVTIMVIPIVVTLGEYAVMKVPMLTARLRGLTKAGKLMTKTEDVANLMADADRVGATVINDGNKVIIKESSDAGADVITTVDNNNGNVTVNGESNLDNVIAEGDLETYSHLNTKQ